MPLPDLPLPDEPLPDLPLPDPLLPDPQPVLPGAPEPGAAAAGRRRCPELPPPTRRCCRTPLLPELSPLPERPLPDGSRPPLPAPPGARPLATADRLGLCHRSHGRRGGLRTAGGALGRARRRRAMRAATSRTARSRSCRATSTAPPPATAVATTAAATFAAAVPPPAAGDSASPDPQGSQRSTGIGITAAAASRTVRRARCAIWRMAPALTPRSAAICSWLSPSSAWRTITCRCRSGSARRARTTFHSRSLRCSASSGRSTPSRPSGSGAYDACGSRPALSAALWATRYIHGRRDTGTLAVSLVSAAYALMNACWSASSAAAGGR